MNKIMKKKGFTLIEVIAVLAIISILFVIFTPKVTGYIKEAKKTKALSEVREVVMAVDSYNISSTKLDDTKTYAEIKNLLKDYIDEKKITSIKNDLTIKEMRSLLDKEKNLTLDGDGKIKG